MAKYKYLITDKYGKEKKGTMEAVSEEAAMRKLKGEGSIVLELSEAFDLDNASWNITIGNPVKKKDITIFCKQFYSILTAGVTVIDGLRMVQDQTENKYLREALYRVMVNVEKGDSLADAMEMENKIFPSLLIHMVAAGEATGNLEIAFDRACRTGKRDFIRFSGCYLRIESGQYPLVCPYFYHDSHCSDGFEDNEVSGCL